ncbi:MAG: hypothetical protein FWF41_09440 [Betaproteobacteria bacterium]|nr:hypothetical protein [Betaproteobacteria bacterium]
MNALDALVTLFCVLVVLVAIIWATWMLVCRFRAGESKARARKDWLKVTTDAIWGL